MTILKSFSLLLSWQIMSLLLGAQDVERPKGFIRDEARSMSTAQLAELTPQIAQFTQRTGVQLYLDTNTFLLGEQTAYQRARNLLQLWLEPQQPGIVLCVNRGASPIPIMQYNPAMLGLLPDGDLVTLSREIAINVEAAPQVEDKMPVAIHTVIQRVEQLTALARQNQRTLEQREWFMAALLLLGAVLLTALAFYILPKIDRDELTGLEEHELPEVEVAQRFGAPAGGGIISLLDYGKS